MLELLCRVGMKRRTSLV